MQAGHAIAKQVASANSAATSLNLHNGTQTFTLVYLSMAASYASLACKSNALSRPVVAHIM